MTRILVSGAGGPAATCFMRAVDDPDIALYAGDIDPYAAGLYLVDDDRRFVLKRGDDPGFVDHVLAICEANDIEVFVPTVDAELIPVAAAIPRFEALGTRVLVASSETLGLSLDKWNLIQACQGVCPVPQSAIFDAQFDASSVVYPVLVKPRRGAGGRGVEIVRDAETLATFPRTGALLVQEYLPGAEYSVDVLCDTKANVLAAVPRERLKVDSGIAVMARTLHDAALEQQAGAVATRIGLTFVGNVQFRRDVNGVPKLLEINVRFPGTMPLTVASGVNMPRLSVDLLLGRDVPSDVGTFRDIGVARYWEDRFVETSAITAMEQLAAAGA